MGGAASQSGGPNLNDQLAQSQWQGIPNAASPSQYPQDYSAMAGGQGAQAGDKVGADSAKEATKGSSMGKWISALQTAGHIAGSVAEANKPRPQISVPTFKNVQLGQSELNIPTQAAAKPELGQVQQVYVPSAGQNADINLLDLFSKFGGGR